MNNQRIIGRGRIAIGALLIPMCVACITSASAQRVPDALENIIFGNEKRGVFQTTVNGAAFQAITGFAETPSLLWPADAQARAAVAHDREAWAAWLSRAADALGYAGFEMQYASDSTWRGNTVWQFELVRRGRTLHGARAEVHWQDKSLLGFVVHLPGDIRAIEDLPLAPAEGEWVYYPEFDQQNDYNLVPARVERVRVGRHERVTIINQGGDEIGRIMQPGGGWQTNQAQIAFFEEYQIPVGTFPDQISVAEDGLVWLSQPNNNLLTSFDPDTETFVNYPTTGGSGPDGMIVGTQGRVWTGLYYNGGLGVLHTSTGVFNHYNATYGGAAMAIPVETSDGHVWVTDHANNRISEFDPANNTWIQTIIMPTSNCWVVQGYEDRDHGMVYYTEYSANKLGRHAVGGNTVQDIVTPGGGPAFCVYHNGVVYYSRWTESGIGAFDVKSESIVEYEFPVSNEPGGPLWHTPEGRIITGTRNVGYIMIFHPPTSQFSYFKIPTAGPGLKDGLTVGADGTIWFTESGVNKLGKLKLLPL